MRLQDKIENSELVFEMEFQGLSKNFTPAYRAPEGWQVSPQDLHKVLQSGKVTNVLKGNLTVGSPWNKQYPIANFGNDSQTWNIFYSQKSFKTIVFVPKQKQGKPVTNYGTEFTTSCHEYPQFSYCDDLQASQSYEDYKSDVLILLVTCFE